MFKMNAKFSKIIPFTFLKALGVMIILDEPSGFRVPASGKGALVLVNWRSGWMTDLLCRVMPCSPGLFIDAGANVGQTLLAYKTAGGDAYLGIEPNPICCGFVDETIALNRLQDCKVIGLALSDDNGLSHLYTSYAIDTGATMVTNLRSIEGRHEQVIPTYSLDNLASSLDVSTVGVVKIDVESYELEVLRGMKTMLAEKKPIIVCEILGTAQGRPLEIKHERNAEIFNILTEAGYLIFNLKKSGDNKKVVSLEPIESFPDAHWSDETKEEFDYLFVPAQKKSKVLGSFNS